MMTFPRLARRRLQSLLRQFPSATILGLRQVGKSTLARWALPDFDYFDLESPVVAARMEEDAALILEQSPRVILDEAQRLPSLFPMLRGYLDRHPDRRVVLLGSASPSLVHRISESLAGRTGFLELGGISILEASRRPLWEAGAFPRLHWSRPRARPAEWHPAFLRTYVEQDIPQLGLRVPAPRILRLLTMLAHAQGSVCNLSELGAAASMSYHSVAHLIDVFEGTFLVRRLQPYFPNVAKRLVKAPKLYIRDTGLLHHLLGIGFTTKAILRHPKAGASFETFCVEQLTGLAKLAEPSAECYFYRTHAGLEVDLILKLAAELIPIEIKLSPASGSARRLAEAMEDLGAKRGYIVNRSGELTTVRKGIRAGSLEAVIATLFPRISRMD